MRRVRLKVQFVGEMAQPLSRAVFGPESLKRVLGGLHDVFRRPPQTFGESGLVRVVQSFI